MKGRSAAYLSRWPLMRRSAHRRIYVKQGEAYRREIEEARAEARRAKDDLARFADSLAPEIRTANDVLDGKLMIYVEVEAHRLRSETPQDDLLVFVRDRLMERLIGLRRDHRGDLRQTERERMFGLGR